MMIFDKTERFIRPPPALLVAGRRCGQRSVGRAQLVPAKGMSPRLLSLVRIRLSAPYRKCLAISAGCFRYGEIGKWLNPADCKSVASGIVGSNPTFSTNHQCNQHTVRLLVRPPAFERLGGAQRRAPTGPPLAGAGWRDGIVTHTVHQYTFRQNCRAGCLAARAVRYAPASVGTGDIGDLAIYRQVGVGIPILG